MSMKANHFGWGRQILNNMVTRSRTDLRQKIPKVVGLPLTLHWADILAYYSYGLTGWVWETEDAQVPVCWASYRVFPNDSPDDSVVLELAVPEESIYYIRDYKRNYFRESVTKAELQEQVQKFLDATVSRYLVRKLESSYRVKK